MICLWTQSGEILSFCLQAVHSSTHNTETVILTSYTVVHMRYNASVQMLCFAVTNTVSDGNYAVQVDVESVMHILYLSSCHKLIKNPFWLQK